jgi:hypothetical protein
MPPGFKKMVTVTDTDISVQANHFGTSFAADQEETLIDIFETYYHGQKITIVASDGENIEHRGILHFFEELCRKNIIARESVIFETTHQQWDYNFAHRTLPYDIVQQTKNYLQSDIEQINIDAKFIGCTISRFSPIRFKLAYQLDHNFPNDNFLIFRPSLPEVNDYFAKIDGAYDLELNWLHSKKFDEDVLLSQTLKKNSRVGWQQSASTYHTLWPRYQIECVVETDPLSNHWFTEKTAKCLATGKPFLLFSGAGSLKTLQNFGFKTYSDVIDESYDNAATPSARIRSMMQSLTDLYCSPDKEIKIQKLNHIANHNKSIHDEILRKIQLSANS